MEIFVLSEILANKESGFYIMDPDFDEVEKEMYREDLELARSMANFGIDYEVQKQEVSEVSNDDFEERLKVWFEENPFLKENILRIGLCKTGDVYLRFHNPGTQKVYTIFYSSIFEIPLEPWRIIRFNPRMALELFWEVDILDIQFFSFFEKKKKVKKVAVKIGYEYLRETFETFFYLPEDKELLGKIKIFYEIEDLVEDNWKKFKEEEKKKSNKKEKEREVKMAIEKALKIFRKESPDLSGWFQYIVKDSKRYLYIFKPRKDKNKLYYSIFKISKGIPQLGIPDKVEPLFAVSTDEFIKKWEDLLEREI